MPAMNVGEEVRHGRSHEGDFLHGDGTDLVVTQEIRLVFGMEPLGGGIGFGLSCS